MVLSQTASLSVGSPFPLLHVAAWLTLVTLLNSVIFLALAPPHSWALLCWSGVQQQLSQPCAWLYARGAAGAVGPHHVSELLLIATVRALWESGATGIKLYSCCLAAPATGDTGSCADHRFCLGGSITTWIMVLALLISSGPCCVFLLFLLPLFLKEGSYAIFYSDYQNVFLSMWEWLLDFAGLTYITCFFRHREVL